MQLCNLIDLFLYASSSRPTKFNSMLDYYSIDYASPIPGHRNPALTFTLLNCQYT